MAEYEAIVLTGGEVSEKKGEDLQIMEVFSQLSDLSNQLNAKTYKSFEEACQYSALKTLWLYSYQVHRGSSPQGKAKFSFFFIWAS